jgi:hypothetical protein
LKEEEKPKAAQECFLAKAIAGRQEEEEMARQMVKGLTMLALLLTLALAATVVTAEGQQRIRANVPFEFIVGDKTLPAGEYAVRAMGAASDVLAIQGTRANHNAIRLTNPTVRADMSTSLVFHRYGNKVFLAQVWEGENGRQLLKSRQERDIQRDLSRIAGNRTTNYEEVVILATAR